MFVFGKSNNVVFLLKPIKGNDEVVFCGKASLQDLIFPFYRLRAM